jgi:hypothetical protein
MRHQHWLSLALMLSLGACGDSTPNNNTTPGTDAGAQTMNDVVTAPTDTGPMTSTDTGSRPDVRDAGSSTTLDYSTVRTGRRCTMDEDCADGQTCITTAQGRICTTGEGCEQGARADEESQCGGRGSTCLLYGSTATQRLDICVRGCVATATSERLGACGEGFVCTTSWLRQPMGSTEATPGCLPHCTTDAHCAGVVLGDAGAMRCNTRTGQCVEGLCGSFINLRTTQQCADFDLETMAPRVPQGDNLAVCIFKNCDTNAQCSDGLVCTFPEDAMGMVRNDLPSNCGYATRNQPNGIPVSGDAGVRPDAR